MAKLVTKESKLRYAIIDGLIEANLRENKPSLDAAIARWRLHGEGKQGKGKHIELTSTKSLEPTRLT